MPKTLSDPAKDLQPHELLGSSKTSHVTPASQAAAKRFGFNLFLEVSPPFKASHHRNLTLKKVIQGPLSGPPAQTMTCERSSRRMSRLHSEASSEPSSQRQFSHPFPQEHRWRKAKIHRKSMDKTWKIEEKPLKIYYKPRFTSPPAPSAPDRSSTRLSRGSSSQSMGSEGSSAGGSEGAGGISLSASKAPKIAAVLPRKAVKRRLRSTSRPRKRPPIRWHF